MQENRGDQTPNFSLKDQFVDLCTEVQEIIQTEENLREVLQEVNQYGNAKNIKRNWVLFFHDSRGSKGNFLRFCAVVLSCDDGFNHAHGFFQLVLFINNQVVEI